MEVPLVGSDALQWVRIIIPAPSNPPQTACRCPPADNAAGGVRAGGGAGSIPRVIFWRCHKESPAILELMQISCFEDMPTKWGSRLVFNEPLCPFASIIPVDDNQVGGYAYSILAVTISGFVYTIRMRVPANTKSSIIVDETSITSCDLSNQISHLTEATSFGAAVGLFLIGGQNGSILCFRLSEGSSTLEDVPFEFKSSEAGFGRLWGLVSRNKNFGSVKTIALCKAHRAQFLLTLHEDGILQVWDPVHHARLLQHQMCLSPDLTGPMSKFMWLEGSGSTMPKKIAVLFRKENGCEALCIYAFDWVQSGSSLRPAPPVLQQTFSMDQGSVVDAKLLPDGLWILQESAGLYRLLHAKPHMGEAPEVCRLQDAEIAKQILQEKDDFERDYIFGLYSASQPILNVNSKSLSDMFLARLLQPGSCHYLSLQELLQNHGVHFSDLRSLTMEGLRKGILAALDLESAGGSFSQALIKWNSFTKDYIDIWRQNNTPYGLFAEVETGCISIVRKDSFSVIRSLSGLEQLLYLGHVESASYLVKTEILAEGGVLDIVMTCMNKIACHLGRLALATFHEELLQPNRNSLDNLITSYINILDIGYCPLNLAEGSLHVGIDTLRKAEKDHHRQQRQFCFDQLLSLKMLRNRIGNWYKVIEAIFKYADQLSSGTSSLTNVSGSASTMPLAILVMQGASQYLFAQFEASRNLLLLLAYMIHIRGQIGMSTDEASRIQLHLIPKVKEALVNNLVLHWLSASFAETPQTEDCSMLLSSLRIDGGNQNKSSGALTHASGNALAETLASSFLEGYSSQNSLRKDAMVNADDLLAYTESFVSWLLDGEGKNLGFSKRAISISTTLLHHGQHSALERFLGILEKFSREERLNEGIHDAVDESTMRLHLLGLCLLAHSRTGAKNEHVAHQVKEAIQFFFRAASYLGERNEALRHLFKTAGVQDNIAGSGTPEEWRLVYFQFVMQIFEQYNLSEGARQFAHAALQHVDNALGDASDSTKGRLWANIFKFSIDLDLYEDAYSAIISNPDEEIRHTCLRRFIVVLCERKATKVLCGCQFSYTGLLEKLEQELAWKAECSDIKARPSSYKLLYSFHMHRHNFRRAAGYIYQYVTRVKKETLKSRLQVDVALQEQKNGLCAAINALHLISPSSAWLEGPGLDDLDCSSPYKRPRLSAEAGEALPVSRTSVEAKSGIVDIHDLEKEHALVAAKLQLVQAGVKHPLLGGHMTIADIVSLLVQHDLFDTAFSILFLHWKDSILKQELEKVFQLMAQKCCLQPSENSPHKSSTISTGFLMLPSNEEMAVATSEKSPIINLANDGSKKASWKTLQLYLEKYTKLHARLPVVVAEKILCVNRNIELPLWLIDMFKGGRQVTSSGMAGQPVDPAALLRMFLDYGRLVEATLFLLEYIRAWACRRPSEIIRRKQACAVWFPYTLIDRLMNCLSQPGAEMQYGNLKKSLETSLQNHLTQMRKDSEDVRSLARVYPV